MNSDLNDAAFVHGQDYSSKLPPEIFCLCFTFLPDLRACITASHVSRFWRATALGFPALWAALELDLGMFKPEVASDVLRMALGRTAGYPVMFEYHNGKKTVEPAIVDAVFAHMHHIRRLSSPILTDTMDCNGIAFFARVAPLLEELSCSARAPSIITPDFLGGLPGRLRTLALPCPIFPWTCPALANVTRLTTTASLVHGKEPQSHTLAAFKSLFDLFPRLVELSIADLFPVTGYTGWVPSRSVPDTLRRLTLAGGCNVMAFLPSFQGAHTHTVILRMPTTTLNASLPFRDIEHAVELELAEPHDVGSMRLTVRSAQRQTEIVFPYATSWLSASHERIAAYLSLQPLARLARMTLPLAALGEFIPVLEQCRSLKEIRLVAQDQYGVFPWGKMGHLPQLPASVTSVALEVAYGPTIQPNPRLDVAIFMEHWRQAFPAGGGLARAVTRVEYLVRGFPTELLSIGEANDIPGIIFEPTSAVRSTA